LQPGCRQADHRWSFDSRSVHAQRT
jgi:hypothetical protein